MKIPVAIAARLISFSVLAASGAFGQDQTSTFTPVTNWSGNYQINLNQHDMGTTAVPTLQSFARATYDKQWVMLACTTSPTTG